jgi:hypothetical protein
MATRSSSSQPNLRYVDRPEVNETFDDTVGKVFFDGSVAQIDFLVSRWDEAKPPAPATGKALTACRLVLSAKGLIELIDRVDQLRGALEADGMLRRSDGAPGPLAS